MALHARTRSSSWKTRALRSGSREVAMTRFRIEVVGGPNRGLGRTSEGLELTIGTDAISDLVLTDPTVSRHHCVIEVGGDGFVLRDLGSTNGTTLGGYRVREALVEPGAVIGVGESALRFDVTDDEIRQPLSRDDRFGPVLGLSPAMRRIFAVLERVAPTDTTILLEGPTGSGKGLIAEAVHAASSRAAGPLVVVDCGAIAGTLIESELFGHERGAFTDAHRDRVGAFESARGGTIFLDEVGELPVDLQPKLLRALERREVCRVGSSTPVPVDVRVVAATNRDLRAEVNRGGFRADLFYRLGVMRLTVPALDERREDIPLLATELYRELSGSDEPPPAELLGRLMRHRWPGNVRELRSAVERALLLGAEAAATTPAPADELDFTVSFRDAKDRAMVRWEAEYVRELVRRHDGNLSRAARSVSMDRNHLRKLLRRYDDES